MAESETAPQVSAPNPNLGPEIPGAPIGRRKPEAAPDPIINPDIPELQDRRRPRT